MPSGVCRMDSIFLAIVLSGLASLLKQATQLDHYTVISRPFVEQSISGSLMGGMIK